MIKLEDNEKIIVKCRAQNFTDSGSPINGTLYLTNTRLIFYSAKKESITMDIALSEIQGLGEFKLLFLFNHGVVIELKNGLKYTYSTWSHKSITSYIKNVYSITRLKNSKHRWVANILLSAVLIYFVIVPLYNFAVDSYNSFVFKSDPVSYITKLETLNNDPTWSLVEGYGYPNLNGIWSFYDDNNDCSYYLYLRIKGATHEDGKFILYYKFDQSSESKKMLSGDFKVVYGKDQYGDKNLLGVKSNTSESDYAYNYGGYIFSISDWQGGKCVRLGPSSNVHNDMFGEAMRKISNVTK